jgi:hypothetical protein
MKELGRAAVRRKIKVIGRPISSGQVTATRFVLNVQTSTTMDYRNGATTTTKTTTSAVFSLRVLAGVALIARAPASKLPLVFEVAGCLLVATSLLIMVAPIRWHGAYGTWWVKRLPPLVIRVLSAVPGAAGAGLIDVAL